MDLLSSLNTLNEPTSLLKSSSTTAMLLRTPQKAGVQCDSIVRRRRAKKAVDTQDRQHVRSGSRPFAINLVSALGSLRTNRLALSGPYLVLVSGIRSERQSPRYDVRSVCRLATVFYQKHLFTSNASLLYFTVISYILSTHLLSSRDSTHPKQPPLTPLLQPPGLPPSQTSPPPQ